MGVKLGLSHSGKNIGRRRSRIGCWGRGEFGSKREEVTGDWRRLHNEELCDVYCPQNVFGVKK